MGRILVADDDLDLSELIALALENRGHEVDVVHHGAAVVDAAATGCFDVVVLDFHMPHLTGAEAAAAIRALPEGGDVPILLLTASATRSEIREALDAGADVHLAKPFSPKELGAQVADLMRGRPAEVRS